MTSINPLRYGIIGNQYHKTATDGGANKSAYENQAENKQNKQLESKEILGFLAAQNADLIPTAPKKTLEVSKYVTPDQEARIEDMMKAFESQFENAFAIASQEFPELSEEAAGELALAQMNASL